MTRPVSTNTVPAPSSRRFAAALLPAVVPAVLVAPMVLTAPRPAQPGPGPQELLRAIREEQAQRLSEGRDELTGWDLVQRATELVHQGYTHHSVWHLWESPATSLRHGRGWSGQYNRALAEVLVGLGFEVQVVHASRVRGLGRNPWWQTGHNWLQVSHQGRVLDVCASRAENRPGEVVFVPMTQVRPVHVWTRQVVSATLAPVVAAQCWRQLLGAEVPRWLYRGFDEPL